MTAEMIRYFFTDPLFEMRERSNTPDDGDPGFYQDMLYAKLSEVIVYAQAWQKQREQQEKEED